MQCDVSIHYRLCGVCIRLDKSVSSNIYYFFDGHIQNSSSFKIYSTNCYLYSP
jgi:hypothetical protein